MGILGSWNWTTQRLPQTGDRDLRFLGHSRSCTREERLQVSAATAQAMARIAADSKHKQKADRSPPS
jgi:hypothetical protein